MDTPHRPTSEISTPPATGEAIDSTINSRISPPTKAERLTLIHTLQSQALKRTDPLLANLEVLNGDMIMLAQEILEGIQEALTSPAVSKQRAEQLLRDQDLYLRLVRQIDRFAQITRQPASKPKGASS